MALFTSMDTDCRRKCYKASTILGSIFILMPNGVLMYWGNMAVYVLSYVVFELSSASGIEAPWIISLFISFWISGLLVYSFISQFIGCRKTAMLGIFVSDVGIAMSYFAVKNSFFVLNFTLGVIVGFGTGIIQGYALSLLVHWAEKDVGFTVSFCQGSFHWGAIIINQLMTFYINPENHTPEVSLGNSVYYARRDVLDNVPSSFLVLLCFSASTHWLGFLLIKENTFDKQTPKPFHKHSNDDAAEDAGGCYGSNREEPTAHMSSYLTKTTAKLGKMDSNSPTETKPTESESNDYSPKEMLRTTTFYALWVTFFFAEFPLLLLINYYKMYGQLWISDDHFLTDLGTSLAFISIWMRILWGIAMDKIGPHFCLALGAASVILLCVWFYFTPMINRWLYAATCCVFMGLSGALYNACINVVVIIFGKKHFSTNLGLLRSSAITLNFAAPFAVQSILKGFGWFYTFMAAGFLNIFSLILGLKFVP